MRVKCSFCNKTHNDRTWRTYFQDGKLVYLCSLSFKPTKEEFIPEYIKEERKENVRGMLQPWREGEASAEFIEAYPKQSKHMFTERERITAKEVWKDIPNHKYWRKTK